ncbi:MAG: amidohydrolase family protein [Verrucomicrobia bacterium]|jgi:L-fuconolactonase|nr:amidohydrolase family protein [Verrucomicrobiota bacterium]
MKIDSHQHFWKYNRTDYVWMTDDYAYCRRDFLPVDLAPLLEAGQLDGSIAVQARQFIKETDFLLELAAVNSIIKGVVGWIPLCDPGVERYLERYAGHLKIVGFRHVIHDEADDQFILRPDFNAGIKALSRYPLCYDVLIFQRHLPQTIEFVDRHPDLRIVIDHIAKPRIRRDSFDQAWAANIKRLAQRENVTCKLSGMVTEVADDAWNEALLKPYFETVLEAFGPERLMFGSDWPVCLMRSAHTKWVETVHSFIAPLSIPEQDAIMGGTAERVYLRDR